MTMQIFTNRPTLGELYQELWKYYCDYKENDFKNHNEITIQIENDHWVTNKWTSGNETTDKFIRDAQLNVEKSIEWIPFNRFQNIKEIEQQRYS
ncbi:hypothetical protein Glove_283g55 [Diversispora epigaea]|uniref:Uncharacterized protein n=1 Tax=Diversispora epigaea TaxID=1348612 RepID=A0A397I1F3_9GLOM|nr:hypothetical protein Glove_283g55 [Diversispora epigaea]